jgi:hypothetical protein
LRGAVVRYSLNGVVSAKIDISNRRHDAFDDRAAINTAERDGGAGIVFIADRCFRQRITS